MNTARFADAPFHLDDDAIAWIEATFARLDTDTKLRQLFNLMCPGHAPDLLDQAERFRPGSITRAAPSAPFEDEAEKLRELSTRMPTPWLVSCDLEGSRMSLAQGAEWTNPLALAAIDDVDATTRVSRLMAREARATGINWSFTPVLDINAAFRSAIVATRGFGSDVEVIERHALAQMEAFQAEGVASSVKHFPGEGYDDRDQHLVTTINPLPVSDWEARFGRLYKNAIDAGVLSVMSAHIAFPSFMRARGARGVEVYRPGSISTHINQTLLREQLGFEGLIVSDSTGMAGLTSFAPRAEHLPELISSGCDVILFSNDPDGDLQHLHDALEDGRLTMDRVDDAVLRQLALKAKLGLHMEMEAQAAPDPAETHAFAAELAKRAPTLVKDTMDTLPLNVETHRRVLVFSGGINFPFAPDPVAFELPDMLADRGFEITIFEPGLEIAPDRFDLILYLFGDETLLTRGRIFLDWLQLTGDFRSAMKRHWFDIPSVMISFGYPYMLYDAPRMPTAINAYCTTTTMQRAVADLLVGEGEWNRNSPVDAFCGLVDARY